MPAARRATPSHPPGEISTDLFMHETTKVARTIGRADNIEVVFSGKSARTNGSKIVLPGLPQDRDLTAVQARAMRGYADHETFHVRKTDMDAWHREFGGAPKGGKTSSTPVGALCNALEDMRIERHGIREYPGAQKNIAGVVELMESQLGEQLRADPALANDVMASGALATTFAGRLAMGTAVSENTRLLSMFGPDVRAFAEKAANAALALRDGKEGTTDAIRLARKLFDDYEQPEPEGGEGGEGEPGEGEEGGEGGNSPTNAHGSASEGESGQDGGDTPEGDKGPESASEGKTEGDSETEGKPEGGAGKKANAPCPGLLSPELGDVIEKEAEAIVDEAKASKFGAYMVANPENDCWHSRKSGTHYSNALSDRAKGMSDYDASVSRAAGHLGVMRRKLERMVLAKQRRDWDVAREQGVLDPKRLTQAAMGNRNVFRVRQERAEIDTAVCVLIDLSSSMHSAGKSRLAQDVAIALGQCLATIGADYAVYGFGNHVGKQLVPHAKIYDLARDHSYGRVEPLDMVVFKEFGESIREAKISMGAIVRCIGGNNSDPDAILAAWDKLRVRPARRRVLITISDGNPEWLCPLATKHPGALRHYTRRAVQRVLDAGGECAGVGLLSDSVKSFYPVWAVASDLGEFADKAMDTLARMMLGERVRVSGGTAL